MASVWYALQRSALITLFIHLVLYNWAQSHRVYSHISPSESCILYKAQLIKTLLAFMFVTGKFTCTRRRREDRLKRLYILLITKQRTRTLRFAFITPSLSPLPPLVALFNVAPNALRSTCFIYIISMVNNDNSEKCFSNPTKIHRFINRRIIVLAARSAYLHLQMSVTPIICPPNFIHFWA